MKNIVFRKHFLHMGMLSLIGISALFGFAHAMDRNATTQDQSSSALDTAITIGYIVSSLGFLVATVLMWKAVRGFGKSALNTILSYLLLGTGIFFAITIFQGISAERYGISNASMDIWWHIMFYIALAIWCYGVKLLINLGNGTEMPNQEKLSKTKNTWVTLIVIVIAIIFIIPSWADNFIQIYVSSSLDSMGVHHFIAFGFAGLLGFYLLTAKKKLGQIGQAIANPLIIVCWSLGLQHLWELLNESWKVINVTSSQGEGGEKIFLTIAAIFVSLAAYRLTSFAKKMKG